MSSATCLNLNEHFYQYIELGKAIAEVRNIHWDLACESEGICGRPWNLNQIIDCSVGPKFYLNDFKVEDKTSKFLQEKYLNNFPPLQRHPKITKHWSELIKAAVLEQLITRKRKPSHISQNVIRPLKVIATCANHVEPFDLTADIIIEAIEASQAIQKNGKLADLVIGVVKTIIDTNFISSKCPLYPGLAANRLSVAKDRTPKFIKSQNELLLELEDRKNAERLPENKAFWELIRIVFTEKPQTFSDLIRFTIIQLQIFFGFRIGEAILIPEDCLRTTQYYDVSGTDVSDLGGVSKSLLIRYFAEKQSTSFNQDRGALFETSKNVFEMFEESLKQTLKRISIATEPLRLTLKKQTDSGRIFPDYDKDAVVSAIELYPLMTGNPFWLDLDESDIKYWTTKYKENFNPNVLVELQFFQWEIFYSPDKPKKLNNSTYVFWNRIANQDVSIDAPLIFRNADGTKYKSKRKIWSEVYLNISELEEYIRRKLPTKLSDTHSIRTSSGVLLPYELMFLLPKRALSEERNSGITDIVHYCSVGIADTALINYALGDCVGNKDTLFFRYGKCDETRNLKLTDHQLRHLLNSVLFANGVPDTLITKYFARRTVTQSHVYEHTTLSEQLAGLPIARNIAALLGDKASNVYKMIESGLTSGPIVDSFRKIQSELGDKEALDFLKVEADGFHSTPYGVCIKSFTVDPCPKNLECVAGCKNLAATNEPENIQNLKLLEIQLSDGLNIAKSLSQQLPGTQNQILHAQTRLDGVRKLLSTVPGKQVFPDGADFSKQLSRKTVLDE